jgi:auxin-responsive protein IAA
VVGWPPIRSFRMNSLFNLSKADRTNDTPKKGKQKGRSMGCLNGRSLNDDQEKSGFGSRCLFVKVNMDGDPIGRKVDLNFHDSYESLAISLELMFWGTVTTSTGKLSLTHLNPFTNNPLCYYNLYVFLKFCVRICIIVCHMHQLVCRTTDWLSLVTT